MQAWLIIDKKVRIFLFISCDKRYCLFVSSLCEAMYTRVQKNVFGKLLVRGLLKSCFQVIMLMEWPLFVRRQKALVIGIISISIFPILCITSRPN